MRETVSEKALRYVGEGRLTVRALDEAAGTIRADVHGNATYSVTYVRGTGWRCSCPARGICCHLTAVQLVVAVERPEACSVALGLGEWVEGDAA